MENDRQPEEFDPSVTEEFQENLTKAISQDEPEEIKINIETENSSSILTISEPEKAEESLPVIDTSYLFEEEVPEEKEVDDEVLDIISSQLASQVESNYPEEQKQTKKRKLPAWVIPAAATASCVLLILTFLFDTKAGRNFLIARGIGKIFADHTTYIPENGNLLSVAASGIVPPLTPDFFITPEPDVPDITLEAEITPTEEPAKEPVYEEQLIHFLLLGMDEDEEKSSDLIMLLTVHAEKNEIKLTTILRDLFVSVPGRGEDKISAVYTNGGASLLYQVFEQNLGLRPDGYLLFTYEGFRTFVDNLGGVNISLTAKEADYLNKTNYISLPENRTVSAGENHLNGDQALGYCRIRHVGTAQNEYNDIGRTARCRRFIEALYQQNKGKNLGELYQNLKQCFSILTTDITGEECTSYLEKFLNMKEISFQYFRIPAEGSYTKNIISGKSTLVADLNQNKMLWQEFLFPKEEPEEPAAE